MNNEQKETIVNYSTIDIFSSSAKIEMNFSNEKEDVPHLTFSNKFVINMIRNTIMEALLKTHTLAKNDDPVMISNHLELNNFHPKRKNIFDIHLTIVPNWGKTLYDLEIINLHICEGNNNEERKEYKIYKNLNITQNDLMCMLHHLLPKSSRHVMRRKGLENKTDYASSVMHIAVNPKDIISRVTKLTM